MSVTPPCVAHLVWPIPTVPVSVSSLTWLFTVITRPTPFLTEIWFPENVATPTLSYPLYSIRSSPLTMTGAAGSQPIYPIIEHNTLSIDLNEH